MVPRMADPVELLRRFVAVRTDNPVSDEQPLAEMLGEELRARQPDALEIVQVQRSGRAPGAYVFARWGRPTLLLNAHLDTVPVAPGWTGDPFQLRVADGRAIGLGACDTKGAIAAILAALDVAPPSDLAVLFSGDEERGSTAVRAFLAESDTRGLSHAIVCEPTGLCLGIRHRGIIAMRARLTGVGGHSSRADVLPAPVAELARLAAALHDWGALQRKLGPPGFTGMCLNVARLDGGVAFNIVPSEAELEASARPPPGVDVAAVREELVALARELVPAAHVTIAIENASFSTRDVGAFLPWLGERVGAPVDLGFWTEAALFAAAGIDAVVLGPGDIAQAHAADEAVEVDQLVAARDLFSRVILAHGTR